METQPVVLLPEEVTLSGKRQVFASPLQYWLAERKGAKCLSLGFRLVETEKGLGEIQCMGICIPGRKSEESQWLSRGPQATSNLAWGSMSLASVSSQENLSELGNSSTCSLKGNPILPCFCKYHTSFYSQKQTLWQYFTFVRIKESICTIVSHEIQQ